MSMYCVTKGYCQKTAVWGWLPPIAFLRRADMEIYLG